MADFVTVDFRRAAHANVRGRSGFKIRFPPYGRIPEKRRRKRGFGVIRLYGAWAKRICGAAAAVLLCLAAAGAADVSGAKSLIPVGHTVGVKLFAKGVMVVKLIDGGTPARSGGLRTGDVILECGGSPVTSAEQFRNLLQEDGGADLRVSRDGGMVNLRVEPERNEDGVCQIGAWIRDSMAGIGTLTWYDPESGKFGALGHGVTDADTGLLMPFQDGSVLPSTVKAVKKGERGAAGELRGDFDLTRDLGALYANTDWGVFGTLDAADADALSGDAMPVGDAIAGEARILSNVRGDEVASYAIEIVRVLPESADGRDMEITVTDPELLAQTGGIVQGMSGSPIVQNGKLVGAVTHVLLQDPAKGYGISMRNMLSAA